MPTHDPDRHTDYLRQCLRRDKAPIGFFLSAGCPVSIRIPAGSEGETEPLIPDIAGMTAKVRETLLQGEDKAAFEALVASLPKDPPPNVEDLLSRVRALSDVIGDGSFQDLKQTDLESLEQAITAQVSALTSVSLPERGTPYRTLAAWAGAIPRARSVEIFTTNYDLLMEQALEDVRVPYFDGFVGANNPFFDVAAIEQDEIPPRWVRLWKLHGSVNWRQRHGVVTRVSGVERRDHALIHPSHLKYEQSRRMPYLAMIDRLRAFLRQPGAALIICGYSFSDEHLNEVIVEGLQGNQTAAAFGLLHGSLDRYPNAVAEARKRSNLSLLAADSAVVGTQSGDWESREPGTDKDLATAPFPLGDFASLGDLMAEIIGRPPEAEGVASG